MKTTPTRSFTILLLAVVSNIAVVPTVCFLVPPSSSFRRKSSLSFDRRSRTRTTQRDPGARSGGIGTRLHAAISTGDKVLIIGGTGGVGQLITKKLCSKGYDVRIASRDVERATETVDDPSVEIVPLDLLDQDNDGDLKNAMESSSAVIISVGTTAFPTLKWKGGNTPDAIDNVAVTKIAQAAAAAASMKRILLVTSVGVDRTKEMPFVILNLFGVLDAKRAGEEAVIKAASSTNTNLDYVIVRPGRLVGGPYTNIDFVKLLQLEGGAENGVAVAVGDDLLGDCKRDACAESIVQALTNDACSNLDYSIISEEDKAGFSNEEWSAAFADMKG